jgi:hypothetical protein
MFDTLHDDLELEKVPCSAVVMSYHSIEAPKHMTNGVTRITTNNGIAGNWKLETGNSSSLLI